MTLPDGLVFHTAACRLAPLVEDRPDDVDFNPNIGLITADVLFVSNLAAGDVLRLPQVGDTPPVGLIPVPTPAVIREDGLLCMASSVEVGGLIPVRLLGNSPVLGLDADKPLEWSFTISNVRIDGKPTKLAIAGGSYVAPNQDTIVYLTDHMRRPVSKPTSGVVRIAPTEVQQIDPLTIQFGFGGVLIPGQVDLSGVSAGVSSWDDIAGRPPVVAAGESTMAAKAAINANTVIDIRDFEAVGDGIANDRSAIQSAIDACEAAGGGTVFFPEGTYVVSGGSLLVDSNNVTLQGSGRDASILSTTSNHSVIRGQNVTSLTIRDLKIGGDGDVAKTSQRGIEWLSVTGGLITNVHVDNMGYDGILLLRGCNQNVVSNCRVEGSQDDGINIGGDNSAPSIGNVVVGCTISGVAHTGIHISDGSSFTTVSGNTVESCGDAGIDTFQSGAFIGTGKHTIVGNTIRSCALYGIRLRESDYNVASSNSISGCGVSLQTTNSHWSEFIGNICTASTTSGLVLDSASQDIMVASNTFDGATAGVTINSPGTQFRGNRVRGVTASSVVVGATGDDSVVDGNIIAAGTGYAISTSGDRCIISANRTTGGFSALRVAASTIECVITSNIVTGGANGIEVSGTDCLVSNNVVNGQTTNGIYVFSATRTSVSDNRSRGSAGRGIFVFGSTDSYLANNSVTSSTGESITENSTSTGTIVVHNRVDGAVQLNGTTPVYRDLSADIVNNGSEYQASFNYQRSAWRQAKATLAASGASVTATNLIPDGALLIGVTSRINTALTGATGYKIGTVGDDDLWGVVASALAGSASGSVDFTAAGAAGALYTAAESVVVTATGGAFTGGEIEVVAHYLHCEAT